MMCGTGSDLRAAAQPHDGKALQAKPVFHLPVGALLFTGDHHAIITTCQVTAGDMIHLDFEVADVGDFGRDSAVYLPTWKIKVTEQLLFL